MLLGTAAAVAPSLPLEPLLDPVCAVGGAAFGAALLLVHMYVDAIKKTMLVRALYAWVVMPCPF